MCSSMEFKIRYVEGLTIGNNKSVHKNVFVVVSTITGQGYARNQASTRLCDNDNTNPTWNEDLTATIPGDTKFILMDIRHTTRSKDKSIAVARIPMSDFVGAYTPENYAHFLSYRLRDCHGEPNGIINFCVKVKGLCLSGHQFSRDNKHGGIHGYSNRQSYVPKPCSGSTSNFNDHVVVGVPAEWSNAWRPL